MPMAVGVTNYKIFRSGWANSYTFSTKNIDQYLDGLIYVPNWVLNEVVRIPQRGQHTTKYRNVPIEI